MTRSHVSAGGAAQQTEEELNKILMHILKELPNLNRITVTSCNLTLLPDEELGKVINLVTLSLEENMLTQLNEGFRNLFNLKELYLSKNHFTRLPKELGYLASLELLSLNHNYLGVHRTRIPHMPHTRTARGLLRGFFFCSGRVRHRLARRRRRRAWR